MTNRVFKIYGIKDGFHDWNLYNILPEECIKHDDFLAKIESFGIKRYGNKANYYEVFNEELFSVFLLEYSEQLNITEIA